MKTIVFYWMMLKGSIIPQGENDGRKMYTIQNDSMQIEYAYKAEVLNYIKTGQFKYNEDLK